MDLKIALYSTMAPTCGLLLGTVLMGFQPLATAQPVSDAALENFVGQPSGTIDNLGNGDATEGSAIKQTFSASAGQTVTLDWNFLTNEATPNTLYNDFAFVSVRPLGGTSTLADTNSRFPLLGNNARFNDETGYNTFSYDIPTTGTYTLGLGVVDVGDRVVNSGLLVDNVNVGTNGSFEAGDFSGWETIGNTSIVDSAFGINPTEGNSQAYLSVPEPSTILGSVIVLGVGTLLKRTAKHKHKNLNESIK
ncbi:PEP-CTERM sorting domain-containing protein [Acaryochloris sp. IP29b_bin.148]|uniref:PEP-CTERM sorting domain-containing protein n=1 Tax=Acaryochloris sp. IP29b_bin.148 TaxID=2969218 RepID=UPI00260688D4|nr:PEP-CTERM sorting domain-containing protein [Acaryochloris sp. IP29b_bin.148]